MNKVIFGINVTLNKKNDKADHEPLITKHLTEWKQHELAKAKEAAEDLNKRASLPKALSITKTVLFIIMIILALGLFRSILEGTPFQTAYHNAAFIFYILPISFLGWIILVIYERALMKKINESSEVITLDKQVKTVINNSADEFSVPEDALEMDFLAFRYKEKDGLMKVVTTGMLAYVAISLNVFLNADKLCFSNLEELTEISLKDFVSVERVDKNALIANWNKNIPHTKEPYKKYKLRNNQNGMIFVKPYYIVTFNVEGQGYDLYVPVYEIEAFIKLTGIDYRDQFTSNNNSNETSL